MHASPLSLETSKYQLLKQRLLTDYPAVDDSVSSMRFKG